jgi:hypothetical protein
MASRERIVQGVAASLLLLCALTAAEGAPPSGPVREVFFGDREETACRPGQRDFVLEELRELYVCIVWAGLGGTYAAQVTFVAPDGNVYQTLTQAFVTAEAPATRATVEVAGRQHAVKRAGWGRRGETLVVATLPIAGTYITQHQLVGLWTVKIALDGRPVDWETFVLHPRP